MSKKKLLVMVSIAMLGLSFSACKKECICKNNQGVTVITIPESTKSGCKEWGKFQNVDCQWK